MCGTSSAEYFGGEAMELTLEYLVYSCNSTSPTHYFLRVLAPEYDVLDSGTWQSRHVFVIILVYFISQKA